MSLLYTIKDLIPYLVVLGQLLLATGIIAHFLPKKNGLRSVFSHYAPHLSFLAALLATTGSLFYSEALGWTPCTLCWYQRICMYPQVILTGILLIKTRQNTDHRVQQESGLRTSILTLSLIGIIIAGYHYLTQVAQVASACGTGPESCATRFTLTFGYISIPLMAVTAFALIILAHANRK